MFRGRGSGQGLEKGVDGDHGNQQVTCRQQCGVSLQKDTLTAALSDSASFAALSFLWDVSVLSFSAGKLPQTGCSSD